MNSLEIVKIVKKQFDDIKKEKEKFNKDNPPQTEVYYFNEDGEPHTVGIWRSKNEACFCYRDKNGYDPHKLIIIPKAVLSYILADILTHPEEFYKSELRHIGDEVKLPNGEVGIVYAISDKQTSVKLLNGNRVKFSNSEIKKV